MHKFTLARRDPPHAWPQRDSSAVLPTDSAPLNAVRACSDHAATRFILPISAPPAPLGSTAFVVNGVATLTTVA